MNVQQLDRKLKKVGVTSHFFHNEGIIFYVNGKSNWEVTPANQTKLEHLVSIANKLS